MQRDRGYVEVKTPLVYDSELWRTSGHWGKYKENIFVAEYEGREFGFKPMNCPGHAHLFGLQRWSYRDLPFRCAEPGHLHRREPSGTLHGLLRVRHFMQDDAHIFCTEDQIQDEVARCLDFGFEIYRMFDFPVARRALHPAGQPPRRRRVLGPGGGRARRRRSNRRGSSTRVNEGDGAFYGPKIDLHMTDSLGRSWQLGTVQLDYNLPERFDLTYTGADNAEHRPVMIHRALFGSFERFIGILIEHYAGEFPLWLAPVQAAVLPIADRHDGYAREVAGSARAPRACAPSSTTAPSPSGARSATPSCARCRTCSWSATARPSSAPSRCGAIARATSGRSALADVDRPADRRGEHSRRADPRAILRVLIKRSNSAPRSS